jgi:hypothetical protein
MTIDRFVTSRALARPLQGAVALAVALAYISMAQAQIPNQQRLLPTAAASTSTVTAAVATSTAASAPATTGIASDEGAAPKAHHVSARKHVTHRQTYAAHKVSRPSAQVAVPAAPQTHYEGTTQTAVATPAAALAPVADTYQAPPVPVVDEHQFPPSEVGHSTNAWLSLQASNRDATHEEPMLGAAATAAYQRYIDSFKHAIPETYASKLGGGGTGGGSQ